MIIYTVLRRTTPIERMSYMLEYKVVPCTAIHPDVGSFASFGLEVYEDGALIHTQSDVSVERDVVNRIARLCNEEQVEPVHLRDVVQDGI